MQTFFILNPEYDKILEQEKYVLMKHVNMSYSDFENMSVHQRRIQLDLLIDDVERQAKEIEKQKNQSKSNVIKRR